MTSHNPPPKRQPDETEDNYRRRLRDWAGTPQAKARLDPAVIGMLDRMERRMVRIETRSTEALRTLGLVPGTRAEVNPGRAVLTPLGEVLVTGPDVTLREIALEAVKSGHSQVPIVFHNRVWGTILITQPNEEDPDE